MSLHEHDQILFDEAIERTKVLLNKDLQTICRAESLQVTGVKQTLIKRVNDREFNFNYLFKQSLECLTIKSRTQIVN